MADQITKAIVVDDDAIIRMAAADILTDGGFVSLEAENADAALRLLEREKDIHLLFTDVEMPGGLDGFALAGLVAERWPDIAIVVCSGRMSPGTGVMPPKSTFIVKPFTADLVHHHIKQLLASEKRPEPLQ